MRAAKTFFCVLLMALLGGCAEGRYYLQALGGHLEMLQAARPLEQWLADARVTPAVKRRLLLAQRIRQFAVTELQLPDNASYRRYADLHRRSVVWNVVAAPPYSLALQTWCFALAGCVTYRGYFSEADARAQAQQLSDRGLEVSVYGVPAYSTLGWLNWAGGDPLLNTFIHYPEGELARMIFHELAHQVLYVQDDSEFNESFATAVERLGGERWLALHGSTAARREYAELDLRRRQFRALSLRTRQRLGDIYGRSGEGDRSVMAAQKAQAMQVFRDDYARLKQSWGGYAAYDAWVAEANNAAFAAQAVYDEWVPAFEAVFDQQGRDWARFYAAARQLAQQPAAERARALKRLGQAGTEAG